MESDLVYVKVILMNSRIATKLKVLSKTIDTITLARLPTTIDPVNYGNVLFSNNNNGIYFYNIQLNNNNVFNIEQEVNDQGYVTNKVTLGRNGNIHLTYQDEQISDSQFIARAQN